MSTDAAHRPISSRQVRIIRVERGADTYSAVVLIDGLEWGTVQQRRGGRYEAFLPNNRMVASEERMTTLREKIALHANEYPVSRS